MKDLGVVKEEHEADLKDRFPHDRVVFFSDAVFAIAITLLAIELKLPDHEMVEHLGAAGAAGEVTSHFIAYFISFLVTGLFWVGHMQTWRHVRRVSGGLVWSTLLQLMFVALMPFATREYSVYFSGASPGRFAFYAFVLAMISLFALITRRIVVRQEDLRARIGVQATRWLLWRAAVPLVVFALCIPMAFVLPVWCGSVLFMLIFPCLALARRWIQRHPTQAD
jgi:uncharacterized membrane protein